ncbi:MAG: hypothetical protein KAI74_00570 [Kiritimatiellae bacterium]|nr:hypothetical protein [Kiritimatiellia bacterium]
MAHSAIHFSIGMIAGSIATFPVVVTAWRANTKLAKKISRWLIISYAAGIYAITPSLLSWIGLSEKFCQGWWMNIFLLHPLINKLETTGRLIPATIAVFLCFVIPYLMILAALFKQHKKPRNTQKTRNFL